MTTICTAALINKGRLSAIVSTICTTALAAAGASPGSISNKEVRTVSNSPVAASSKLGSSSSTDPRRASAATGRVFAMFSTTGVIFSTTLRNAADILSHNSSISASGFPNPAAKSDSDAFNIPIEPEMVSSASRAVVPVMPISV